ncbi:ScyD/ScyE family protein [Tessaracoccus lubricantis]|uniref:ScyD/ScyE family protein n=1 Tax=Tessaracoccus lubricantis TaxID=545543 RepID=A0ABP9EY93_9ACTN
MKFRSVALASATLLVLVPAGMAQAAPSSDPTVVTGGLTTPLHLSAGPDGTVAVAQSFAGMLSTVTDGEATTVHADEGWEIGGVDYQGDTLYFLQSMGAGPEDPRPMVGILQAIDAEGNVTTITDELATHEIENNLDAEVRYGLSVEDAEANPECVAELGELGIPASYAGADVEVDSHAYSVAVRGNTAYVADAGANAVLAVNLTTGAISTVAVLPAQMAMISDEAAAGMGVPSCGGLEYGFEAVPTDIEFGPGGKLYVGLLPGGPEDPSLGARGSVYSIDLRTGEAEPYVTGLLSPTGIAFQGRDLYVASLFGGAVYKVDARTMEMTTVLEAPLPSDIDISGSTLYALTQSLFEGPSGQLVSLKLK